MQLTLVFSPFYSANHDDSPPTIKMRRKRCKVFKGPLGDRGPHQHPQAVRVNTNKFDMSNRLNTSSEYAN